ncbi:MAG TPA: PEP-CTERM sorting domain-containing protein [Edaphobacter sp.]|nr:PEP-CTERM sorting domain-containing protein [Edaphobacter sp.]
MRLSTRPFFAFLATFTLATLLITSRTAHADTVDFSYTGSGPNVTATGSGSFVYSGSTSTLTLASLTGFTFTDTITQLVPLASSSFTYSLADLTSFSATLSGDTLLTLSLQTGFNFGTDPLFRAESFTVTNLGPGGSSTHSSIPDEGIFLTSTGQVTETGSASSVPSVPEPSTLALFGTGILGLAGAARRKLLSR